MWNNAKWVNKYSFDQLLFRPLFADDESFLGVDQLKYLKEVKMFQRPCGMLDSPQCFRRTYIQYQFYGSDEWVPEEELFATREEALDYAKRRTQQNLERLKESLSRIEAEGKQDKEK